MAAVEQVLVTGGGSGLGREFVKLFLRDGARVLVASLVEDELSSLHNELASYGDALQTLAIDLSESDAAARLLDWCDQHDWTIDVLVNNAGFATFGDLTESDLHRVQTMVNLNVLALTSLATLFGARMKARGRGDILNVGSTAGMVATQRLAAYGATKAYVNQLSYALRAELKPFGVNVTCLTPAAVATRFAQAAAINSFKGKSMLRDTFAAGKASTAADVARAGFKGLRRGQAQVLTGNSAWMVGLMRLLPPATIPALLKNV